MAPSEIENDDNKKFVVEDIFVINPDYHTPTFTSYKLHFFIHNFQTCIHWESSMGRQLHTEVFTM